MQTATKSMAVKLPEHDRERLNTLGKVKKRTPHWLAKEAINQYLDREEKAEQFRQETMDRWEEFCRTGQSVPNEAVMAWLESWGSESEHEAPA